MILNHLWITLLWAWGIPAVCELLSSQSLCIIFGYNPNPTGSRLRLHTTEGHETCRSWSLFGTWRSDRWHHTSWSRIWHGAWGSDGQIRPADLRYDMRCVDLADVGSVDLTTNNIGCASRRWCGEGRSERRCLMGCVKTMLAEYALCNDCPDFMS